MSSVTGRSTIGRWVCTARRVAPLRQALAGATGLLLTVSAMGAEPDTSAGSSSGEQPEQELVLDEVIVTATKRRENVQRVPQAVSVMTSERLDQLNARKFEDYFRDVPGLMLVTTEPIKRDYSLRGIGSGNITSNAATVDISTVSQYYDDVSVTSGGFQINPHLVDIERVEVLRGPQGTLYGEGALGGMIRVVTRKPELDRYSGSAEARVSSTQDGGISHDESLTLNLPLVSEVAALRLNGYYAEDGGYIDAVYRDSSTGQILGLYEEDYDSSRSRGFRGQLLVRPSDSFSVLAQYVHSESDQNIGMIYRRLNGLFDRINTCRDPAPPPPPPAPGEPPPPPPDPSGMPLSATCPGGQFLTRNETTDLFSLNLEADLGWATLVSSSSYAQVNGRNDMTYVNTFAGSLGTDPIAFQDLDTFVQEVRLVSSESWSERWDYVVGAYYQDKQTTYVYPPFRGNADFNPTYTNRPENRETALFGDVGYMLTERLQARLGLRVSKLRNEGTVDINDPGMEEDIEPQHPRSNFNPAPITGRAVLTYFFNPEVITYASIARGFRNGTLNNILVNYGPASQEPGFVPVPLSSDPDSVTTYEWGWKLTLPAFRATLGAALFHTDWKDMQVQSYRYLFPGQPLPDEGLPFDRFRPVFVNAARSRVDGVELEASMEILPGLQGRISFAYLDAVLTEDFPLYDVAGRPVLHGAKGDRIPFVAKTSGSVSLSYQRPVFGTFKGFVDLNGQYQGSRATDFSRLLNTSRQDGGLSPDSFTTYNLLRSYWSTGMQIGVQNAQWRAALTLDNVFNTRGDVFHSLDGGIVTRPRTVGLFVRRNFD